MSKWMSLILATLVSLYFNCCIDITRKVVALEDIAKNQILGIYEGNYVFQCEHDVDRNVLNEVHKQFKVVDVCCRDQKNVLKTVYSIPKEVYGDTRCKGAMIVGENVEFFSDLLVDGYLSTGPFAWTSECNDYRKAPLKSVEGMHVLRGIDIDDETKDDVNVCLVTVYILVCGSCS
jgi:hypothetical protein